MDQRNIDTLKTCISFAALTCVAAFLFFPDSVKNEIADLFDQKNYGKKKGSSRSSHNFANFFKKDSKKDPILFPIPQLLDFRHVQGSGQGIGYGTNYSTFAMLLAADCVPGRVMPMIDVRVHHFDKDFYAGNVGIGGRYLPPENSFCDVLGFNAYYDVREGKYKIYSQIGVGLEVLGKRWEFRANGYFPIGIKRYKSKCSFNYEGGYFAVHRRCEFTAYGYNGEIGYYPINSKNFSLFTAVGPYYLVRRNEDHTLGGEARIRPQYKDYFALEFKASYDPVFKAVYQVGIIFHLPLYQIRNKGCSPCNIYDRQIYQPVQRFEIMPLGRHNCWHTNF